MKGPNAIIDDLQDKNIIKIRPAHLKARLVISLILLIFSTLGVFIAVFAPSFAWHYWLLIVPIFAILCIWLSWHVARKHNLSSNVIWHEVIHWLALLVAVYLVSVIVNAGIINYLAGALFILILLALVIFLAGVHFDPMFMLIGILLGLLAVCSALFVKYLIVIMIPAVLIIAILLVWRFTYKKKAEE